MAVWQDIPERVRSGFRFAGMTLLIGPACFTLAIWSIGGFMPDAWLLLLTYANMVVHFCCYILLFFPAISWFRARPQLSLPLRVAVCVALSIAAASLAVGIGAWTGLDERPVRILLPRMLTYGLVFSPVLLLIEHIWDSLGEARRESEQRTLAHERERRAAAEARWNSLESRLHPHFVFNTLASIRELLHQDSRRADFMIQRFAELLRFSLDAPHHPLISLDEELGMVRGYLEIEQMRLGDRLTWQVDADGAASSVKVLSQCVLTLVENAIKHAISTRRAGGSVTVSARIENELLRLEVADDGSGFAGTNLPPGHGLNLLRERLLQVYGGGATLRVKARQPGVSVEILLPTLVQELTPHA
jgi:signal transduction histidine kinase